jgi:hypothetical protein
MIHGQAFLIYIFLIYYVIYQKNISVKRLNGDVSASAYQIGEDNEQHASFRFPPGMPLTRPESPKLIPCTKRYRIKP